MATKCSDPSSQDRTIVDAVRDGTFVSLSDEDALRLFAKTFGRELEQLKRAEGTIEGSGGKTLGNLRQDDESDLTPSRLLLNKDFEEPNRTLVSFLALKWVLADNYKAFTFNQPPLIKMTEESFKQFHELAVKTLSDPEHVLALIVAIVVGDVGKDPELVKEVREKDTRHATLENHDEVIYTAAMNDMLPALNLLDYQLRKDVIAGLRVGSRLNIPQLAQGENVPGSLDGLSFVRRNKRAFYLKYLEILFDVAGAGGQTDSRGAKQMWEPVYQNYNTCLSVLLELTENKISYRTAYDSILAARAEKLAKSGFRPLPAGRRQKPLSVDDDRDRALLRIMLMGRAASKDEAELFDSAFSSLDHDTKCGLVDGLNVDGTNDGEAILPYYMPAIFSNSLKTAEGLAAENHLGSRSTEKKKIEILVSCLRFLNRVYGGSKKQPGTLGHVTERNVSFASTTIKSPEFFNKPQILERLDLPWETSKDETNPS